MSGPEQVKPPNFLAPVIANATAPAAEAVRRAIKSVMPHARLADVPCPRCGTVLVVWAALTGCLYRPTGGDALGLPLSTNRRERVTVACTCHPHATWKTSGRGVGRALHNGRPPLA
jgi:hypothetical protein